MKLPLIAACLVAGTTWSFASADQTSAANPKTAIKPFVTPGVPGSKVLPTTKTAPVHYTDQELGAMKARMLNARKLAALGQNPNPQVGGGGMQNPNPSASGGSLALGGGDDCGTPDVIAGLGSFAFDTTAATTSGQQQGCGGGAAFDVWFSWTAPSTGACTYTTCGGSGSDTVLAVWSGSGCGATPLACNDDACALQSSIGFPVTAGQAYMLQLGGYFQSVGTGTFTLNISAPIGNDDCSAATPIAGAGPHNWDNNGATTGGQQGLGCGTGNAYNDVWYSWTATGTGNCQYSGCGFPLDTVCAAYAGAGCPTPGTYVGCNDDGCGGIGASVFSFPVVAGNTYMIQVGAYNPAYFGSGAFTLNISAPAPNDSCTTPVIIAGTGVFPFDNGAATTGTEGQNESLCAAQYGQFPMQNDVWFQWTAPQSGIAVWDDCGLTTVDTKVASYAGTGCPASGTALACTDDSCPGFQTTLTWPVTAGATYTIQVGTFPGAFGGIGSFSLNVIQPPTNDDCTGPVVLAPAGPYPFALLGASTGAQGQNEALCNFYGLTAIENDIWFTWTAPSTARANLTLCFGSSFDSKAAVYNGAGCPVGSAIACNDDACGLTTEMCFDVTGGNTYTIQIGTFPGAGNNFVGSFDIFLLPPNPPCTLDDGTTENLLVWVAGGDMVWLNAFGTAGGNTTLSSVDVMWGSAMFPGYNPASNGDFATDIFIWQDGPSQDQDPSDASLLLTIPTTVTVWDSDTYVSFPIAPLAISGTFFVGCHQDSYGISGAGPTQYVAPMDQNCPTAGVAWFFGNNSGFGTSPVDYNNPANNVQPPVLFQNIGLPCQVMVRAGCNAGPATYLCDPGSGPTIACPCANPPSGSGRGCNNSSATGGASISGSGNNSLGTPTLVFTTAGEKPTATSILLQGTASNPNGLVFGQGVRCATGVLKRLYVKTAVGGSIVAPNLGGGDLPIPARSAALGDPISAGQNRWYMVYYRDPIVLGGCSALSTFNATNTAQVLWQP